MSSIGKRTMNEQHVAVVTGAASGIGAQIATRFAGQGSAVGLLDVDGARLEREWSSYESVTLPLTADVQDSNEMDRVAALVREEYGHVDVLVVNAGIGPPGGLEDLSRDSWKQTLGVNLDGGFNTMKAFLPTLLNGRGHRAVVVTASVLALRGSGSMLAYGAAKAGLVGLTRAAAQNLAKYDISVNAVAPGPIRTPLLDSVGGDALDELEQQVPLGRLGTPDDVADAVMFLASSKASFITGQVLVIDGGLSTNAYWRQ